MANASGGTTRCAVLVGPYQSGKTALFEALLHATGAIERKGTSNAGNMVGDASDEARKRQASTELSIGHGSYLEDHWVFIDTPGSVEFAQETRNACLAADIAIVVVDSEAQKIPACAPILKFLDEHDIPRMVFINKIDTATDTVRELMAVLQDASDSPLALRHVPIRDGETITGYADLVSERAYEYNPGGPSKLIQLPDTASDRQSEARADLLETLADFDDSLMEKVLEEVEPEKTELYDNLTEALQNALLVPVLIGAGENDHGVQRLLKQLRHEAPSATQTAERRGLESEGEAVAQVFKTMHAQHMGKMSYVRVWRGAIKDGETLNEQRVSGINALLGAKLEKQSNAAAGDIVALGRMDEVKTGDVLTPSGSAPDGALAWPAPLAPVYALAISAANRNDEVKLSGALQRLAEEDTSVNIAHNAAMGELIISGQGETQINVLCERLANRFNLTVNTARPSVPYKETIKKTIDQHARHKKQSGGHGQFGDVKVKIKPRQRGAGFEFIDSIVGGAVPRNYIPSVEDGVKDFMNRGPLGFEVVDLSVELYDGQFHAVDSSDMAFKTAARMAMSEGLPKCSPTLLEPVLHVKISAPNDATARIQRIITGRRGQILGFQAKEGWKGWDEVEANIPESDVHDLIIEIRSVTMGAGTYEWEFDHLAELSGRLADQVIEQRNKGA
ncbi:MAG: elongation factor G [Alphaproteobacteria bacterium]|nr:elongation factor G [Alphaproteobacteria bacterium]